jgi:integrase
MSSCKFYLNNKPNSKGEDLLMIHISYSASPGKYKKLPISSGISVKPKHWLQKKQLVGKGERLCESMNNELDRISDFIGDLLIKAKGRKLMGEDFVTFINDQWKKKPKEKKAETTDQEKTEPTRWEDKSIWPDWEDYLKACKNTCTPGTIRQKEVERDNVKLFEVYDSIPITWGSIDLDFYSRFLDWCFDVKDYKNSQTGRMIKAIKAFMEWAFNDNDRHFNVIYKKKAFSKPPALKNKVWFYPEELWAFYNLKISDPNEKAVRDGLLLSCFTGLRHSDIELLGRANLHKGWLNILLEKGSNRVVIPLSPEALQIIEENKGSNPSGSLIPIPTDQECNRTIHDILKRENFNRPVELIHMKRKQKIRTIKPLHEAFTFHSGKKTFYSLFKKFGGATDVAMSMTGNADERVIKESYETIDEGLKKEQMDKVWSTWRKQSSVNKN